MTQKVSFGRKLKIENSENRKIEFWVSKLSVLVQKWSLEGLSKTEMASKKILDYS